MGSCTRIGIALYLSVCCFRISTAANDELITELVARIGALERKGQAHETLIEEQRAELGALRSVVQEQKEKLLEHEATIQDLTEWKDAHLKSKTSEQILSDDKDSFNQSESRNLASKVKNVERSLMELRRNNRIVMDGEGPVAFQAVIPGGEKPNLGQNQKIVFDHVNINLGGGYHNQHGLFIAPVSGIYIFSTSAMSYTHQSDSLQVAIMKNGSVLGAAYAHSDLGSYDQGSVSIVTQLAVGDEVWVTHRYGSTESIWGDYYSSFMGCLIFQM